MPFILGRKIEMTQKFKDDGSVVPVTLVKAETNYVTQVRQLVNGVTKVQIGADVTKKAMPQAEQGHLKDLPMVKTLREFIADGEYKRGDKVEISVFTPGTKVDVTGISKGHGFAGVVKRHHFHGQDATHGTKDQMRMPGSLASQRQGPVTKGQRMAGHMGVDRVTVKNLEIISVSPEENILAIKGAVPGARGSLLLIKTRDAKTVWQK